MVTRTVSAYNPVGLIVVVAAVALLLLWLHNRGKQIIAQVEQGARAPLNVTAPAFWGLKDDGSTFGTRGWWSNIWSAAPELSADSPYAGGAPENVDYTDDGIPIVY